MVRSKERETGRDAISQCVTHRTRANAQGTQYAERIMPPQSQISLYCCRIVRCSDLIERALFRAFVPRRRALASLPGCYMYTPARIFTYVRVHVHIRRSTPESRMNRLKKRAGIARAAIITSRSFILAGTEMHAGSHKRIPRYREQWDLQWKRNNRRRLSIL